MNMRLSGALGMIALCTGLAACSTTDKAALSQKTVEYSCGADGQQALSVQYTFQGNEVMAAKVVYDNKAIDLNRETSDKSDIVGNTFKGNGYTWRTEKFTLENVGSVNGDMLTQDGTQTVNGNRVAVSNILAKQCKVRG
jgi:membrane-bound inhibitor of C-type lysozyme